MGTPTGLQFPALCQSVLATPVHTLVVPAGATNLKFVTSGGTGDADVYARFGSQPTTTTYDCRSEGSTNAETCTIATAQAGTYHVLVRGYAAYSGLSITGSYTTGGGGGRSRIGWTRASCSGCWCGTTPESRRSGAWCGFRPWTKKTDDSCIGSCRR